MINIIVKYVIIVRVLFIFNRERNQISRAAAAATTTTTTTTRTGPAAGMSHGSFFEGGTSRSIGRPMQQQHRVPDAAAEEWHKTYKRLVQKYDYNSE